MILFTRNPLDRMRLIQPFGVDYVSSPSMPDFYKKIGLAKGHNGWDLSTSALNGANVYAIYDGFVQEEKEPGYGVNARLFIDVTPDIQLEVVYAHLEKVTKGGRVQAGDLIALSDNTGYSTGPHLHLGVRMRTRQGTSTQVLNYDNGYYGYMDPAQFFPKNVFELPVDRRYGHTIYTTGVPSDLVFYKTNLWFWMTFRRLMTTRERNALQYGFWDVRSVLDPAMFPVWSELTKPEARKRKLVT
jgi:murein DD-endopeptidase MepM/ murein hydrolase activator NlpD